jgi:peptidyl-tRNA hydrolase
MLFALNPSAPMSAGKAIAQVSHAVLMCARSAWASDPRYAAAFAAWRQAGYPCRIAPPKAWAALHAGADGVVVRDAGLTEVAPGTETVLALPPGYPIAR